MSNNFDREFKKSLRNVGAEILYEDNEVIIFRYDFTYIANTRSVGLYTKNYKLCAEYVIEENGKINFIIGKIIKPDFLSAQIIRKENIKEFSYIEDLINRYSHILLIELL